MGVKEDPIVKSSKFVAWIMHRKMLKRQIRVQLKLQMESWEIIRLFNNSLSLYTFLQLHLADACIKSVFF